MSKIKYTPKTKAVQQRYVECRQQEHWVVISEYTPEFKAEFKRWLAERDRKVIAKYEAQKEKLMDKDEFTLLGNHIRAAYLAYSEESLPHTKAKNEFKLWLADIERAAFDDGFAHGAEYGHVSQEMWPTH
jgi:hypothetical protein